LIKFINLILMRRIYLC